MGNAARRIDPHVSRDPRASPRARVYVSVDVFSGHNFWTGLTMNLSEGGLFVATHNPVPVGTLVVLHITLPFEPRPIVTLAEVRWSRGYSGQEDVPPGVGLQFIDTDPESLGKIRTFVSNVREPLLFES